MHISDPDAELLKTWIIRKLADISDADSDVLADYVLALIRSDDSEQQVKQNCVENLRDFLGDNSASFVDSVLAAIASKEYDPSQPRVPPKIAPAARQPPRRAGLNPPKSGQGLRKRSYHDWDRDDSLNAHTQTSDGADRPLKQARRGGFGSRGGLPSQARTSAIPSMPALPTDMPPFDPNDPMAAFLAMSQMMSMMSGFPSAMPSHLGNSSSRPRCRDYDTKGFCSRGASCSYEHGSENNTALPGDQHDPNQANFLAQQPSSTGFVNVFGRGGAGRRGGSRVNGQRRDTHRAAFSHSGPNSDESITTIVVEQIPEENFDETSVRDFFGQFGNVTNVDLQPYKRLAVVAYDTYDSALAAYESPQVIFDNRFVKVYWYKPPGKPELAAGDAIKTKAARTVDIKPQIDMEEVARRQAELQKKQDEKKRAMEEAAQKRKEIDSQLKLVENERQKMIDKLAQRTGASSSASSNPLQDKAGDNEVTKGLREQLAQLQEEAKSLGIDPDAIVNGHGQYPSRGRGGYRNRARGMPYYHSFKGGRGGGAVKRLDNRPKTVMVKFLDGVSEKHDETLRSWLLFNSPESGQYAKHPSLQNTALVTFEERYQGDVFMAAVSAPDFPLAGKVELSWYGPEMGNAGSDGHAKTTEAGPGAEVADVPTNVQGDVRKKDMERSSRDVDYDVAGEDIEDFDRW